MKEKLIRFRLACSLPALSDDLCEELDPFGEGNTTKEILDSQEQLRSRLGV